MFLVFFANLAQKIPISNFEIEFFYGTMRKLRMQERNTRKANTLMPKTGWNLRTSALRLRYFKESSCNLEKENLVGKVSF